MNDEVKEAPKAYDYAGKMKQYREDWERVGVKGIHIMLPTEHMDHFKAMGKLLMAKKALEVIEDGDEEILDVLSNRKIRLGIERTELLVLIAKYKDYGEDAKMQEQHTDAKTILELYDMMGMAKSNGTAAIDEGKGGQASYWWARECALSLYISGAIELLNARDSAPSPIKGFTV